MVPGSITGGVTGDFFRGSPRQNHVPWGWLSLWKWVPGISPGIKAAGTYCWWPTTLVVLNIKKIWSLNLPGTPWATSARCGMTFTFILYRASFIILHYDQQMYNYFTNYPTATCFDTIGLSTKKKFVLNKFSVSSFWNLNLGLHIPQTAGHHMTRFCTAVPRILKCLLFLESLYIPVLIHAFPS